MIGGVGDDWFDGGGGNDVMKGDSGNDTYVVDSLSDLIVEDANRGIGGVDVVTSSTISLNLASFADVEDVTLSGRAKAECDRQRIGTTF